MLGDDSHERAWRLFGCLLGHHVVTNLITSACKLSMSSSCRIIAIGSCLLVPDCLGEPKHFHGHVIELRGLEWPLVLSCSLVIAVITSILISPCFAAHMGQRGLQQLVFAQGQVHQLVLQA